MNTVQTKENDNSYVIDPWLANQLGPQALESNIVANVESIPKKMAHLSSPKIMQPQVQLASMRTFTPAPPMWNTPSISPEEADSCYRYNNCYTFIDYGGQIKSDLVQHIAEIVLTVKADAPEERARFLPPDGETNELWSQKVQEQLGGDNQFPCLTAACAYDFGEDSVPVSRLHGWMLLSKAYQILSDLRVDTSNPFLLDVESQLPFQSKFRLGLFARRPFQGLNLWAPAGDMLMPQEIYCSEMPDARSGQIWPVGSLVKSGDAYIKPCFLPHGLYSLWGLDRLLYSTTKTIILTPDLHECIDNSYHWGMAVLSWFGSSWTLPKVDFGPLAGRTIYYVFNPGSFGGDYQACLQCMNAVWEILQSLGCNVVLMANPAYAQPAPVPAPYPAPVLTAQFFV